MLLASAVAVALARLITYHALSSANVKLLKEVGRIGLLSVSASYAGVYPWFYALDLWEMDC